MIVTSHGTIPAESCRGTPPKTNKEPENDGLEDDFPSRGAFSDLPGCIARSYIYTAIHLKDG